MNAMNVTEAWPQLRADPYCPTWAKLSWWDRLWRKSPERLVFKLPDGTFVCSAETKSYYERNAYGPLIYRDRQ
jgi:hypothetical protein